MGIWQKEEEFCHWYLEQFAHWRGGQVSAEKDGILEKYEESGYQFLSEDAKERAQPIDNWLWQFGADDAR